MPTEDPTQFIETNSDGSETEFEITTALAQDNSLNDQIVEALFDGDAQSSEVTYADLDGDGSVDTGAVDSDGDGRLDMVAGDTDSDGTLDAVSADTDGDGKLDVIVLDSDADGRLESAAADTDGDGKLDAAVTDEDGDGLYETAAIDNNGDGEADVTFTDDDGDGEFDVPEAAMAGLPTEEELSSKSIEFTVGEDGFPITGDAYGTQSESQTPLASDYSAGESGYTSSEYDAGNTSGTDWTDPTLTEGSRADAAAYAQARADEYIAQGDYAAAAEARAEAEEEAYAAGDTSMLSGSDSSDLENAAYRQELAEDYRIQQAEHIADGDYEAAKEDALNAGYQTGDADYLAGGSDHTGQNDQDAYNLDNAVYQEKNADYFVDNAQWYAEQGNPDAAQSSMDNASAYQASADSYADSANPVSTGYDVDTSSALDSGGGYDMSAVDTGFDAAVDTSSTSAYDSGGVDDGTV